MSAPASFHEPCWIGVDDDYCGRFDLLSAQHVSAVDAYTRALGHIDQGEYFVLIDGTPTGKVAHAISKERSIGLKAPMLVTVEYSTSRFSVGGDIFDSAAASPDNPHRRGLLLTLPPSPWYRPWARRAALIKVEKSIQGIADTRFEHIKFKVVILCVQCPTILRGKSW